MPKGMLEFDLPSEQEEFDIAIKAGRYQLAVEEVWERLFRPYYKHGYANETLNKLANTKSGGVIIEELAKIYREIVEEYELK